MTALSAPRNTPRRETTTRHIPIGAGVRIWAGAMAGINPAGFLVPVTAVATLKSVSRAEHTVDNLAGANGAAMVRTSLGTFRYENSVSTDLITRADIGSDAYGVDDQTVAKTSATNTRSVVGKIADVDDQGVWVTHA